MRWEDRRRSENVEDRRRGGSIFGRAGQPRGGRIRIPRGGSSGGLRRAGGGSIILFVVVGLALWIFVGINPLQLLDMLSRGDGGVVGQQAQERSPEQQAGDDRTREFLSVVLAETEDTWSKVFRANGASYEDPRLVIYSGAVNSGCGFGTAAVGPFYCPNDQQLYVDLSFFETLAQRLNAPGDFAQAYVLAHEVGHHVQNLTGILGRFDQARQSMSETEANAMSVRVELQADCYAGVWAHFADRSGIVEDGDIDEAIGAASAVGDDNMQRRSQGYAVPESFNHGTAQQRSQWFRTGYRSGDPAACDTFEGTPL